LIKCNLQVQAIGRVICHNSKLLWYFYHTDSSSAWFFKKTYGKLLLREKACFLQKFYSQLSGKLQQKTLACRLRKNISIAESMDALLLLFYELFCDVRQIKGLIRGRRTFSPLLAALRLFL